jgi:hypothetical protein
VRNLSLEYSSNAGKIRYLRECSILEEEATLIYPYLLCFPRSYLSPFLKKLKSRCNQRSGDLFGQVANYSAIWANRELSTLIIYTVLRP